MCSYPYMFICYKLYIVLNIKPLYIICHTIHMPNTRQMVIRVREKSWGRSLGGSPGGLPGGSPVGSPGGSLGGSPGGVGRQGGSSLATHPGTSKQANKQTRSQSRPPLPNAPRDQNKPFGHPLTLIYIYIYVFTCQWVAASFADLYCWLCVFGF